MPKYLVEMDEPYVCDHCLFFSRGGEARCNMQNLPVSSEPPDYYHPRPLDCPLKKAEWQRQYTVEALYCGGRQYHDRGVKFDNIEQAVGYCVIEKRKNASPAIESMRVVETTVPSGEQLVKIVWRSEE